MNRRQLFFSVACAIFSLGAPAAIFGEPASPGPIHLLATIQIPGNPLTAFDISWVDPATHTYYLADRSNSGIDIVDTQRNTFITRVGGFAGNDKRGIDYGGPNGVLVIPGAAQAWAGDGDSKVRVVDLASKPPAIIRTIESGGRARADELAYDAKDHLVMVANNADDPAFVTFISAASYKIMGKIDFSNTKLGIEQSVWDPISDRFYLAVPAINGPDSEVAEIDPGGRRITHIFKISGCAASGLALGPGNDLLVGCWRSKASKILNRKSGATIEVSQVGGSDEVWFSPGDMRYYLGSGFNHDGPVLGVIDARTRQWIQNVRASPWAHSVAVDPADNHVFVPLTPNSVGFDNDATRNFNCANGCIGVYGER